MNISPETFQPKRTNVVKIGEVTIGGPQFVVMAGPCSIESSRQFNTTASAVLSSGARIVRGGIFKLRSLPDSFQGLRQEAFEILIEARKQTYFPFIAEITDPRQLTDLYSVVDAFQVGSRNMHNYELLKELGRQDKPVMLKRGFSGLISEWLSAADYILGGGNNQILLCERGIRTFETATRNTFDLNAVAYLKETSPFPVVADPSHATGKSSLVTPMAMAAAAAGADGLIVEVHPDPAQALSDGFQALTFKDFEILMSKLKLFMPILGRTL